MKRKRITLTNDYHNSEVNLLVDSGALNQGGAELSPTQISRARRELCGVDGCTCGDDLGMRGSQSVHVHVGSDRDLKPIATVWSRS